MADMQTYDYYWWKNKLKNGVAQSVFAYVGKLDNSQGYRQADNIRNVRLYGNFEYNGLQALNYVRTESSYNNQNRVTLNICQSMVDTAVSKITKNKPKPYFLTDGGDFSLQRKAKKLTDFVTGQFYATDFYAKSAVGFKDAAMMGTGAIKIYVQDCEIKAERVFIDEIIVDDRETLYGAPRQMHQKKWIHKDVLMNMFPSKKKEIEAACGPAMASNQGTEMSKVYNSDMLLTIESWKLKSGKTATDGVHHIGIYNTTLSEDEYTKDYFPFVFYRWSERPLGFFGQGICEQLTGLQLEINKILRTIQVSMHLVSVPKIFVEASSKIVTAHLNNKIGGIIKYVGQAPIEGKLGSIPTELFTHLNTLYQRAFEIVGLSQLSAQSQKPAGLNSGKAMRTYNDIESERFYEVTKRYENSFLDAAKIMVDLAKDISEETNNYSVKVPGADFLQTINWSDVEMSDDQYSMQIFPTSSLSDNPSQRLSEVQELMQAGLVSKEDGMKLLDFPDLKAYYNMTNSGVADIERQIELMADKGEYEAPEPYQNLIYGIPKMQQAYLLYKSQGAPDETLELFRNWISDADELLKQSQQKELDMQAQAQAAAMQPQGPAVGTDAQTAVPTAQPVSDLLPVV